MSEPKKLAKAEVELQAPAAMEEVIDSSFADLLKNAKPEDLVGTTPDAEVRKTTALPSNCLIYSPGNLQMLSVAYGRLVRTAGPQVKHVNRVNAHFVKGTKILVIQPAPDTDLTAYEVKRYDSSSAWINLSDLLLEYKLAVETGWKERYAVAYIPKGSPLGKGVAIDLGAVKERSKTN
ncbi:MAG TPA: hypothetical protein VNT01_00590, partial [Symbiobacteriaceae bacterium]|nr:hypothetical protein [Symbiobacteriaceae bacterium]